ncbi:MAG: UMP kinase [Candidatus Eisenbacteria sp.]|nr:UMP kinase [Candidatus Eisenbacteria bacterium]
MSYGRILLKFSGDLIAAGKERGAAGGAGGLVGDLVEVHGSGVQVGVVVGGGNLLRGAEVSRDGTMGRAAADAVGMLGTVINALVLEDLLERSGVAARVLSALHINALVEPHNRRRALWHLEKGRVVIFAGGTGNSYLTTDTAAALRAAEIGAQALLKATKVDGIYAADPMVDRGAERFDRLSYTEVLKRQLGIMDAAAVSICRETGIPIVVFDGMRRGNLQAVVRGEIVGTVVGGEDQHE